MSKLSPEEHRRVVIAARNTLRDIQHDRVVGAREGTDKHVMLAAMGAANDLDRIIFGEYSKQREDSLMVRYGRLLLEWVRDNPTAGPARPTDEEIAEICSRARASLAENGDNDE